jgi:hypothetical protein
MSTLINITIPEFGDSAKLRVILDEKSYQSLASDLRLDNKYFSHAPERYPTLQVIGDQIPDSNEIAVAYFYDYTLQIKEE